MRRSRFSEDQIIGVLREHESGVKTADLCRKHGISDATFYTWKSKYGGLTVSDAARLRALEDENRRLKSKHPGKAALRCFLYELAPVLTGQI